MEDLWKTLNSEQRQAVDTVDGPVLVIAGPGTGKTQLLSARVAKILKKTDFAANNILLLTFTEAGARNMRERLQNQIGEAARGVAVHTFHSFGADIIQRYPEYFLDEPLSQQVEELGAYEVLLSSFEKLPHTNPLHIRLGDTFFHLPTTRQTISWFKQAGLEPKDVKKIARQNKLFIDSVEPLLKDTFTERTTPKELPKYQKLLTAFKKFLAENLDNSLAQLATDTLTDAVAEVNPGDRYAKLMTAWRNQWLVQNRLKEWGMADKRKNPFISAVAKVYDENQKALQSRGWYTFDDMILRTIRALEQHEALQLTLQEQYQYIMVDEFQDTNGAQNKLLELLADNPVNEDRPNLLVVGDDDQAIYRFQGAHVSIMADFVERWREVKTVILTKNYRSGAPLLEFARSIITQGQDRLEDRMSEVTKDLVSGQSKAPKTTIQQLVNIDETQQYACVADTIKKLVDKGAKPDSVAVLAPRHKQLQALVPFLQDRGLPVSYDRKDHLLNQPKIVELLDLGRLIQAAADGRWVQANALLPAVLASEYWEIEPQLLWDLSLQAYKQKVTWFELLSKQKNPVLKQLAEALPILAAHAQNENMEIVLDELLGNRALTIAGDTNWRVPYRDYYFSDARLRKEPTAYFNLLSQLSTLREHLREYRPGTLLKLRDLIEFADLYQGSGLTLSDSSAAASAPEAVNLMTAYAAKGLEWPTVILLGVQENTWGTRTRSGRPSFGLTTNLATIKPARDTADDHLRLFYVAITRAKNQLYLASYEKTNTGRGAEALAWLQNAHDRTGLAPTQDPPKLKLNQQIHDQSVQWEITKPQRQHLKLSLAPVLSNFQLSATHINSFLDIRYGGPKAFFYRHLLRFPEAPTESAALGSAVHKAIQFMHNNVSASGELPSLPKIFKVLKAQLSDAPIPNHDRQKLQARGQDMLKQFYEQFGKKLQKTDRSEYSFKQENVLVDDIRLSGQLDVLRQVSPGQLAIIDYKTGKPLHNWKSRDGRDQIKAHLYQQQLAFYQLLVNGSSSFGTQEVEMGIIQFLEADEQGNLPQLTHKATEEELIRLQELIRVIWQHIIKLDFPDISGYPESLKGLIDLENDLLSGKI